MAKVGQYHAWANALTPIMREDLQKVRTLVAACGLDPGTATAAQMDALDARVTCISPVAMNQLSEERQVMTWRRAVLFLLFGYRISDVKLGGWMCGTPRGRMEWNGMCGEESAWNALELEN